MARSEALIKAQKKYQSGKKNWCCRLDEETMEAVNTRIEKLGLSKAGFLELAMKLTEDME